MMRFAEDNDIPAIMNFINQYWKRNHVLSFDRELFEFQHKWGNEISFVLSERDGIITGVLGYIPYSRENRDVALAIWKANKTEDIMQGVNILFFLRENGNVHRVFAPGINPETAPIYKFLGLETGKMKQWYRLREVAEYRIAKITDKAIPPYDAVEHIICEKINSFAQAQYDFRVQGCLSRDRQMAKSLEYIERRYFKHPSFDYLKYGLRLDDKKLFVVLRVQEYNGSAVLRVIDCIGDHELFACFTPELDRLLEEWNCECADCYETGIKDDVFLRGGWKLVAESKNVIPDYFAPFEQNNVDIYYMSEIKDAIMFKGDGDMDRPN